MNYCPSARVTLMISYGFRRSVESVGVQNVARAARRFPKSRESFKLDVTESRGDKFV